MKETNDDVRSDYSRTLLALATKQSGLLSPLCFGESNVKSRVRNILNYKRPVFWVAVVIVFIVVALAVGLLANSNQQLEEIIDSNKPVEPTNKLVNNEDYLELLGVVLPENWRLDKSERIGYKFIDEHGKERGTVSAINYIHNFDILTQMPNHSSVTVDEYIDIPLGQCRLITLDADNGSAASGNTGTHDVYYAVFVIGEEIIYVLDFTNNDKNPETKAEFIDLLNKLVTHFT